MRDGPEQSVENSSRWMKHLGQVFPENRSQVFELCPKSSLSDPQHEYDPVAPESRKTPD